MSARGPDPAAPRAVPFFDQGLFLLRLNRGKEHVKRGEYDAARRELEDARHLRPHDPEVTANLSLALFHLGQYDEAERLTRPLLALHPDSVPLLFNLGLTLWKAGRDAEAKEPLLRILELAPAHRKAHLTLGLVLQRSGDSDTARYHFRLAGAERAQGGDGDDTVSRTARNASQEAAAPPRATPLVKPEGLETGEIAPVPERRKSPSPVPMSAPPPDAAVSPGLAESAPAGPFTPRSGGFLAADCTAGIVARRGALTGRTGAPSLEADRRLAGALARQLVIARGPGTLLLLARGRVPRLRALAEEFVSVEPGRLLAFEASLAYREDPAFEFRRTVTPFLKLFGTGHVALAVVSEPARFEVSEGEPLTIAARAVVAFGGDLAPDLLEEADAMAELGAGPVLRFSGTGYVLAD
ncbi:MAG TPA: tetratricopeptide repeat protein [Thermoanaerobaculia bacterium]|nr:tetratricopeptide repeat protein [Thermoanaerobaculia bacterium]